MFFKLGGTTFVQVCFILGFMIHRWVKKGIEINVNAISGIGVLGQSCLDLIFMFLMHGKFVFCKMNDSIRVHHLVPPLIGNGYTDGVRQLTVLPKYFDTLCP